MVWDENNGAWQWEQMATQAAVTPSPSHKTTRPDRKHQERICSQSARIWTQDLPTPTETLRGLFPARGLTPEGSRSLSGRREVLCAAGGLVPSQQGWLIKKLVMAFLCSLTFSLWTSYIDRGGASARPEMDRWRVAVMSRWFRALVGGNIERTLAKIRELDALGKSIIHDAVVLRCPLLVTGYYVKKSSAACSAVTLWWFSIIKVPLLAISQ